jgi:hypothetical protein
MRMSTVFYSLSIRTNDNIMWTKSNKISSYIKTRNLLNSKLLSGFHEGPGL